MTTTPHAAKTTRTRKPARARVGATPRRDARKLVDLVREAIDDGATTVEEIHRSIAALPLDILGRLDGFEDRLANVRRIQDESIDAVYDVIRRVNREVTRLAADLLEGAGSKRPRKRAQAR
jgi:uncharacterized NAD-dependent epimerase/dehydratase family protein